MSITKSPWIIHYDGSSCNGCDIEVLACLTPMYDVERFGVVNTGNPKHADIFLVTGAINEQNISVVKQIYDQMPSPKVVVAIGVCAASGGIFRNCYNIVGGVDQVLPVDVYVPGCAARPEAIIDGVVKGLGVLAEKQIALNRGELPEEVSGAYLFEGPHDESGTLLTDDAAARFLQDDSGTTVNWKTPAPQDFEEPTAVHPTSLREDEVDEADEATVERVDHTSLRGDEADEAVRKEADE